MAFETFIIKDTPNPRRLTTLKTARDYLVEAMRLHRPNPWRELWHRFKTVKTEEEAIEAIGDLRELLVDEDLLLPSEGPARSGGLKASGRGRFKAFGGGSGRGRGGGGKGKGDGN